MPENTIFRYSTAASLQKAIDSYFKEVKAKKGVASLTGLALHLGCTRKNLTDYSKTDEFGAILERAKLQCENVLEERMINGTPPTGIIFILKNNYGWKDKIESEVTLNGTVSLSALFDKAAEVKKLEERNSNIIEGETIQEVQQEETSTHDDLPEDLF